MQLHLPNLFVGGIERWALTLMRGAPEVDWCYSTPEGVVAHPSLAAEFAAFQRVHEMDAGADALITTWGTTNRAVVPTIAVAHSAFQKYREMIQTVRYDHAVAVSDEAGTCFPNGETVAVIPNGVDTARLARTQTRVAVRNELGIPEHAVVVGYVGRWGFQKNPLAAALAASTRPGAVALYVGPMPEEAQRDAAARLAPCCFVEPERARHMGDLYGAMDVCVFASRTEGFGLAIAEAWFSRTPVIATRVGVVAEQPDLVTLVPQEPDIAALKQAVEQALGATHDIRDAARKAVLELYSAEVMSNRWRRYIKEVL